MLPQQYTLNKKWSSKLKLWVNYYFDPTSPSYFNKTQSAIRAYRYNPQTQYNTASCVGYKNYRKVQIYNEMWGATILERDGITFPVLLMLAFQKAREGKTLDVLRFMEFIGYASESPNQQLLKRNKKGILID